MLITLTGLEYGNVVTFNAAHIVRFSIRGDEGTSVYTSDGGSIMVREHHDRIIEMFEALDALRM
jgi:hypothetical protein